MERWNDGVDVIDGDDFAPRRRWRTQTASAPSRERAARAAWRGVSSNVRAHHPTGRTCTPPAQPMSDRTQMCTGYSMTKYTKAPLTTNVRPTAAAAAAAAASPSRLFRTLSPPPPPPNHQRLKPYTVHLCVTLYSVIRQIFIINARANDWTWTSPCGAGYCASQQSTTTIEDIGRGGGSGAKMFQLYILRDREKAGVSVHTTIIKP